MQQRKVFPGGGGGGIRSPATAGTVFYNLYFPWKSEAGTKENGFQRNEVKVRAAMRDSLFRRSVELYEMIWRMQTEKHNIGFVFLNELVYD